MKANWVDLKGSKQELAKDAPSCNINCYVAETTRLGQEQTGRER